MCFPRWYALFIGSQSNGHKKQCFLDFMPLSGCPHKYVNHGFVLYTQTATFITQPFQFHPLTDGSLLHLNN